MTRLPARQVERQRKKDYDSRIRNELIFLLPIPPPFTNKLMLVNRERGKTISSSIPIF
jgi:hypothetical protein